MKKFNLLIIAIASAIAFSFASCNKDDTVDASMLRPESTNPTVSTAASNPVTQPGTNTDTANMSMSACRCPVSDTTSVY